MEYVPKRFNQSIIDSIPNLNTKPIIIAVLDTGVDPMAYGLKTCPDGSVKVIDVIDCTGSDTVNTTFVKRFSDLPNSVKYVMQTDGSSFDDNMEVFNGTRSLRSFVSNRKYKELTDAQKKVIDDEIMNVFTYKQGEQYKVVVENHTAVPLSEYHVNYQSGSIVVNAVTLHFAVHVYDGGKKTSLVFDTGTHATHVAGIIAGYFPDNPEQNGINPNAKILSLKIGDTRVDGMETSEALCRALDEMVKYDCSLANYSFGEDVLPTDTKCSGLTGRFIDKLNEYTTKYNLVFVTSAGNSGPSLFSVGAPAMCTENCISVGAYTDETLLDKLYFTPANGYTHGPYHWSSRGPKFNFSKGVDLMAPGCALTSHPHWFKSNMNMCNGTSMACPNAVGVMSLVLERYVDNGKDLPFYWIKKYFENTCRTDISKHGDEIISAVGNGLIMTNLEMCGKQINNHNYAYEVCDANDPTKNGSFLCTQMKEEYHRKNVSIKIMPKFNSDVDSTTFRKELCVVVEKLTLLDSDITVEFPKSCIVDTRGAIIRVCVGVERYTSLHCSWIVKFVNPIDNTCVASYPITQIFYHVVDETMTPVPTAISVGCIDRKYFKFTENNFNLQLKNLDKYKNDFVVVCLTNLSPYNKETQTFFFLTKEKEKHKYRKNVSCIPNEIYEMIVYVPWNAGKHNEFDVAIDIVPFNTTTTISKNLLVLGDISIASTTHSNKFSTYKSYFDSESKFEPYVSSITSHYLPDSENIVVNVLTMTYKLSCNGTNKYYVDTYNKVYNSKVTSGANLFGLLRGKIMFMGNYVPKKYTGQIDEMRIVVSDNDLSVLKSCMQMVLYVKRKPSKKITEFAVVHPIENGYMANICLTNSVLKSEKVLYDDIVTCKLKKGGSEKISYINKCKNKYDVIQDESKFVSFCKSWKSLSESDYSTSLSVLSDGTKSKENKLLYSDVPYFRMLQGLDNEMCDNSKDIFDEIKLNKLTDTPPFCAYEWLFHKYHENDVPLTLSIYDSIERTKKHGAYWHDFDYDKATERQLKILDELEPNNRKKRMKLENELNSEYGF